MAVQTTYSANPAIGFAGMLYDANNNQVDSAFNNEASAEIPFGRAVCQDPADDKGVLLPDDAGDIIVGILVHSHAYAKPLEVGDDGVKSGVHVNILRKGRILVPCVDGCSPGDRLFVRQDITGGGTEVEGGLETAIDTDNISAESQGVWRSTAAAGELAILEVDFTNEP